MPEEDAEKCQSMLKHENLSSDEFDSVWKACSRLRIMDIKSSTSTSEILTKWPYYKQPTGYRLVNLKNCLEIKFLICWFALQIDMDFSFLFETNDLISRWDQYVDKIRSFLSESVKDKTVRGLLAKLNSTNDITESKYQL